MILEYKQNKVSSDKVYNNQNANNHQILNNYIN